MKLRREDRLLKWPAIGTILMVEKKAPTLFGQLAELFGRRVAARILLGVFLGLIKP